MTNVARTGLQPSSRCFNADVEEKARTSVIPGQPDIWVLVLIEALTFSSYFVVYMIYRMRNPELYLHSQAQLSVQFGVFNTLVLLTSSWSMARCVHSAGAGNYSTALSLGSD